MMIREIQNILSLFSKLITFYHQLASQDLRKQINHRVQKRRRKKRFTTERQGLEMWQYAHRSSTIEISVCHSASVSSFKSSLKTFLFLKTFLQSHCPDLRLVCVCARARACVYESVCLRACVRAFMLYALNFDKYVFVENV